MRRDCKEEYKKKKSVKSEGTRMSDTRKIIKWGDERAAVKKTDRREPSDL